VSTHQSIDTGDALIWLLMRITRVNRLVG